jgi:TetR/AcrR family transcriptional regulator, transcriptional repressor for nem operon
MTKAFLTRKTILGQAFEIIYKKGYQATSIDEIIAATNVTKGAFFYHFKNKEEMGLAMINEIMYPGMVPYMANALGKTDDVLQDIYEMIKGLLLFNPFFKIEYGCPAVNLIDEMAPIHEGFKKALMKIILEWQESIERALLKAQKNRLIRSTINANDVAVYITANYSGVRNLGKIFGKKSYSQYLTQFKVYLENLK